MTQRGGLQGVIRTLLPEMIVSESPQLVIDQRQDRLQRLAIPVSPMKKEFTQLLGGSWAHYSRAHHNAEC
jgi:hypothetical protein